MSSMSTSTPETPDSSLYLPPLFDKEDIDHENKIYYNDIWRRSIEERQNRPLTISEYEKWYETAANCDMHSELEYVKYISEYNERNEYTKSRLVDLGNVYPDDEEKSLSMPSLLCTGEQLITKLAAITSHCRTLEEENKRYKKMLNNFKSSYAFSPERQKPTSVLKCPDRPVKAKRFCKVQFLPGTQKNLFPVKTEQTYQKKTPSTYEALLPRRQNSFRYVETLYENDKIQRSPSLFYKASELIKKLDNPIEEIMSEGFDQRENK